MIKSIVGWFDKFEFVLNVAFIVFFFEGPDDLIFGIGFNKGFGRVHEFDKVLEIHLNLFSLEEIVVYFDDEGNFKAFLLWLVA